MTCCNLEIAYFSSLSSLHNNHKKNLSVSKVSSKDSVYSEFLGDKSLKSERIHQVAKTQDVFAAHSEALLYTSFIDFGISEGSVDSEVLVCRRCSEDVTVEETLSNVDLGSEKIHVIDVEEKTREGFLRRMLISVFKDGILCSKNKTT